MDTTLYPGGCPGLHKLDQTILLRRPRPRGRPFLFGLLSFMAKTFLYRCPNTAQTVQGSPIR